jgi:hypothetical protein
VAKLCLKKLIKMIAFKTKEYIIASYKSIIQSSTDKVISLTQALSVGNSELISKKIGSSIYYLKSDALNNLKKVS